jgi:hypothetical protein
MKKVYDKDLERRLIGLSPTEAVLLLRDLQDASGLKICANVSPNDPAYREV